MCGGAGSIAGVEDRLEGPEHRLDVQAEGIALALAAPRLLPGESFATSVGLVTFDGASALGASGGGWLSESRSMTGGLGYDFGGRPSPVVSASRSAGDRIRLPGDAGPHVVTKTICVCLALQGPPGRAASVPTIGSREDADMIRILVRSTFQALRALASATLSACHVDCETAAIMAPHLTRPLAIDGSRMVRLVEPFDTVPVPVDFDLV